MSHMAVRVWCRQYNTIVEMLLCGFLRDNYYWKTMLWSQFLVTTEGIKVFLYLVYIAVFYGPFFFSKSMSLIECWHLRTDWKRFLGFPIMLSSSGIRIHFQWASYFRTVDAFYYCWHRSRVFSPHLYCVDWFFLCLFSYLLHAWEKLKWYAIYHFTWPHLQIRPISFLTECLKRIYLWNLS